MTKIITSPAERVQKTVIQAYSTSTGEQIQQWQELSYTNSNDEKKFRTQKNLYNNLLWLWYPWSTFDAEYKSCLYDLQHDSEYTSMWELELQDEVCKKFLQWTFESWNPYTISMQRVKLLLKGFDQLNHQSAVKIIAMRHGHRIWSELTDKGIQEAQAAGGKYDFWFQDIVIGTHQMIIESVLISLIWWSQWLSPQQARDALPFVWQSPYKTAQVTEFLFSKNNDWEKILKISTNDHTETLTEQQCRNAYDNISQRPL